MNNYWRAFGSAFFLLHQGKILWLLNAPVIGRWFRWVLRIHGKCSSVGRRKIFRINPNAIFWWNGDKQVAEFRTHAKFSKRLYYAFRPLWWVMHVWDWCVADRWVPRLSFGFSTLEVYPDEDPESVSVDGYVYKEYAGGSGVSFATIRGLSDGSAADPSIVNDSVMWLAADTGSNNYKGLLRSFYLFNTAALTSGASIFAAVLSIRGSTLASNNDFAEASAVDIVTSTPASDTNLVVGDFDQVGGVSQTGGSKITQVAWDTGGYNAFPFDATGIGNISKTSISKFAAREANFDLANSAPTWGSNKGTTVTGYFADQTGTTNDPKLVVTYTIPATGQVIMISRNPMTLKTAALLAAIGTVIKNPSITRRRLFRWWQ